MVGRHDLGRTPSLVNTQVAHDVGDLEAAVSTGTVVAAEGSDDRPPAVGQAPPRRPPRADDLRLARRFRRNRRREAVAELRGVAHHEPSAVTGVRTGERTPVGGRRVAVEVEERLRAAEREARPLNEGAVRTEVVRCGNVAAVLVLADTDRDVTAHRTVFGLVAGIGRDVTAGTEVAVVRRAVIDVLVRPTPGEVTVLTPAVFGTDPAANLDAHVGAGM